MPKKPRFINVPNFLEWVRAWILKLFYYTKKFKKNIQVIISCNLYDSNYRTLFLHLFIYNSILVNLISWCVNFEEFYTRHDNVYVEFRFDFLIWHTCIDIRIHFTHTERWQCIYYGDTCHLIDNANMYGLISNVSLRKSWDVDLMHTTINQSEKKLLLWDSNLSGWISVVTAPNVCTVRI